MTGLRLTANVRERDLVGREGRFIAEGKVVLNVTVVQPGISRWNRSSYSKTGLLGLTEQFELCRADVPIFCVSPRGHGCNCRLSRCIAASSLLAGRSAPHSIDALIEEMPTRHWRSFLRHFQPRQYGFDLSQRRRFRGGLHFYGRNQLRSTLPQGDPRFGRGGIQSSLCPAKDRSKPSSPNCNMPGFEFLPSARPAEPISTTPSPRGAVRCFWAQRAKACQSHSCKN